MINGAEGCKIHQVIRVFMLLAKPNKPFNIFWTSSKIDIVVGIGAFSCCEAGGGGRSLPLLLVPLILHIFPRQQPKKQDGRMKRRRRRRRHFQRRLQEGDIFLPKWGRNRWEEGRQSISLKISFRRRKEASAIQANPGCKY